MESAWHAEKLVDDRLDAVGTVADGADEVFEQVFQRHHGDHVTVGVGDQREVAVAAAQPG